MSSDKKSNTPARPVGFNVARHEAQKNIVKPDAIKRAIIWIAMRQK